MEIQTQETIFRIDVLIASLHLLLIVPLLLQRSDDVFDIYTVDNEKFSVWFLFGMDLFSRSLLDWAEVYEVRFSDVNSSSMAGKHLILFLLISIDILLIQSIIRLIGIRRIVRTETLATLIRIGKIEQANRLLSSNNVGLRASALQWLLLAPDGPHYLKIRQLENDPTPSIRISMLESLEDAPLEIASPSIIKLLNDQNDEVRIEASRQLRRLTPENILKYAPLLLGNDSIPCRIHGVEALATVEDGRVVPYIVDMFEDEDERVRIAAQQAIEHLQRLAKLAHNTDF